MLSPRAVHPSVEDFVRGIAQDLAACSLRIVGIVREKLSIAIARGNAWKWTRCGHGLIAPLPATFRFSLRRNARRYDDSGYVDERNATNFLDAYQDRGIVENDSELDDASPIYIFPARSRSPCASGVKVISPFFRNVSGSTSAIFLRVVHAVTHYFPAMLPLRVGRVPPKPVIHEKPRDASFGIFSVDSRYAYSSPTRVPSSDR